MVKKNTYHSNKTNPSIHHSNNIVSPANQSINQFWLYTKYI
jgi:hypothetical protein